MIKIRVIDPQKPDEPRELDLQLESMLNHECLIGRYTTCNLVLHSDEVSRLHGKISFKDGHHYFTDLASRGGSRLNAESLRVNQDYPLKMGDMLQIGSFFVMVLSIDVANPQTIVELKHEVGKTAFEPEVSFSKPAPTIPPGVVTVPPLSPEPSSHVATIEPAVATIEPAKLQWWTKKELTVRCVQIIHETHDVKTFRFVADPLTLFTYKPGQFVTLELEIDGESVSRSYSISSTPSRPHTLEITVKRVSPPADGDTSVPRGLVSNWLHEHISVGNEIKLSGPMGKFTCVTNPCQKLLLFSAGSGITPMMSMSRWLMDTAADCDIVFFHCARTPRDIIFRQELEMMAAHHPKFQPAVAITRQEAGDGWMGFRGRLDAAMLQSIAPDFRSRTAYVCGPNPFMESVYDLLESVDFPMQNHYEESFGPPRKKTKKVESKPSSAPIASDRSTPVSLLDRLKNMPEPVPAAVNANRVASTAGVAPSPLPSVSSPAQTAVLFRKSGKEIACDGEEPILNLAEQEGVKIRSSCRSGVCGTCKKLKLEGNVKMEGFDPEALEDSERQEGYILTCIAYPVGRVVIDA